MRLFHKTLGMRDIITLLSWKREFMGQENSKGILITRATLALEAGQKASPVFPKNSPSFLFKHFSNRLRACPHGQFFYPSRKCTFVRVAPINRAEGDRMIGYKTPLWD